MAYPSNPHQKTNVASPASRVPPNKWPSPHGLADFLVNCPASPKSDPRQTSKDPSCLCCHVLPGRLYTATNEMTASSRTLTDTHEWSPSPVAKNVERFLSKRFEMGKLSVPSWTLLVAEPMTRRAGMLSRGGAGMGGGKGGFGWLGGGGGGGEGDGGGGRGAGASCGYEGLGGGGEHGDGGGCMSIGPCNTDGR